VETDCARTVARADPRIPIAGRPKSPKMRIGFRTALRTVPRIMKRLAPAESPAEIRIPFPIMGSAMVRAPRYQIRMKAATSGSVFPSAPSRRNSQSMLAYPATDRATAVATASAIPWVTSLTASARSWRPIACATSAVTPVPIPPATKVSSMTTGKVKDIAASGTVPRRDTKYASVRLYAFIAKVPASMGNAVRKRVSRTLPPTSVDGFQVVTATPGRGRTRRTGATGR